MPVLSLYGNKCSLLAHISNINIIVITVNFAPINLHSHKHETEHKVGRIYILISVFFQPDVGRITGGYKRKRTGYPQGEQ